MQVCLKFKAKVVRLQTTRAWGTSRPCWFKMLRGTHTYTPAELTHECPQISLFYKPGAFIFKRGGCQEMSKHWFFFLFFFFVRPWVKRRTCQIHMWDYWEPSPVKMATNKPKSCEPVSALSPPVLHFIYCEHRSAMKTAFKFPSMWCFFFFFQYNHFNLLAEGALEKRNTKK